MTWLVATGYAETTVKNSHADLEWLLRYLDMRAVRRVADVTPELLEAYSLWLRDPKQLLSREPHDQPDARRPSPDDA